MPSVSPAKLLADDFEGDWQKDMPEVFRLLNKFSGDTSAALATQLSLTNLGAQKIAFKSVTVPSPWQSPTYTNSWVDFGTIVVKYRLGSDGWVSFQGTMKSGVIGSAAFTLPSSMWPAQTINFACDSNSAYGKLTISPAGVVTPGVGSNVYFALDNVRFEAATPAPWVASCFPLKVTSQLASGKASLVLPGLVTDLNTSGGTPPQVGNISVQWHNETGFSTKPVNNIVIDNIQGLIPGQSYSITLWAIP